MARVPHRITKLWSQICVHQKFENWKKIENWKKKFENWKKKKFENWKKKIENWKNLKIEKIWKLKKKIEH